MDCFWLSILIPNVVPDALGGTPNCGPVHAGAVDHHRGDLDSVVRGIGGFVDRVHVHTLFVEISPMCADCTTAAGQRYSSL